jgi:hypothetical protein
MRVLIAGDLHGRHAEFAGILRRIQTDFGIAAAIQVGDFGFYREAMARMRRERMRFPVPVHAIDGNHEDHRWLRRALLTGAGRAWREEANLLYHPRPSVARIGATTVGFLGGALHVDRPQRHNLLSRFPNYILRRQREHAAALFNRERPDLLVTHSCPSGIGIGMRSSAELDPHVAEHVVQAGFDPGPPDDCGEAELSRLWRDLSYRPKGWVFGHFHRRQDAVIEGTRFACVGADLEDLRRALVLWDTEEERLLDCQVGS